MKEITDIFVIIPLTRRMEKANKNKNTNPKTSRGVYLNPRVVVNGKAKLKLRAIMRMNLTIYSINFFNGTLCHLTFY